MYLGLEFPSLINDRSVHWTNSMARALDGYDTLGQNTVWTDKKLVFITAANTCIRYFEISRGIDRVQVLQIYNLAIWIRFDIVLSTSIFFDIRPKYIKTALTPSRLTPVFSINLNIILSCSRNLSSILMEG